MVCCVIAGCANHSRNKKDSGFVFHRFPRDTKYIREWINACKRADSFCVDNARVCSAHFDQTDYCRDLKAELLKIPSKLKLKPDAVPHLLLPTRSVANDMGKSKARKNRAENRNSKKLVNDLLNSKDGVYFEPLNPELVIVEIKEEHDFEEEPAIKNELSSADEEEASNTDGQDAGLTMRRFDGDECVKEEEIFVESEFGSCAGPDDFATVDNNDGEKQYPCKLCNYKATQPGDLSRHMRTHTGEKPYPCKLCNYKAAQPGHLSAHMRTHKGEKPYPCKLCNYKATQPGHLSLHMRTHTGEKPYPCQLCNYKAAKAGHLTRHMRTHTGEKPYPCKLCNYKATQPGNLSKHMRTHTGEKPYPCKLCNYKAGQPGHLSAHMRTHKGEKPS